MPLQSVSHAPPRRSFLLAMVMGSMLTDRLAWASSSANANLTQARAMLAVSEDRIDLAQVKLAVDRMIDPRTDVDALNATLNNMARQAISGNPAAQAREKLDRLRGYLYSPGHWNNNVAFSYDRHDPLGNNIQNKLMGTYLATKKGNCISMPLLLIILGHKIGLDMAAALAPEHLFVKFRESPGDVAINLEATSGAKPTRDVWLREKLPMTDAAIANGVYMRALSRKETVVVILSTLMEFYAINARQLDRLALAQTVLEHAPRDVNAMLHMAAAYDVLSRSSAQAGNPQALELSIEWEGRARNLGWRPL